MIFKILKLIFNFQIKLIKQLFNLCSLHVQTIYLGLDPVSLENADDLNKTTKKSNYYKSKQIHYLIPLLAMIALAIDCLLQLNEVNYEFSFSSIPNFFTHKIYPKEYWFQGDICGNGGSLMELLVYGMLYCKPFIEKKYLMFKLLPENEKRLVKLISFGTFWNFGA